MGPLQIDRIYVDREVANNPLSKSIFKKLASVPVTVVRDKARFLKDAAAVPLARGKRMLWLTQFKGPLLKPCPATGKSYLCCRYWTLNAQINCPLDCAYCVLQNFLNFPFLTVFVNIKDALREIDALLAAGPERVYRVGTGELTDSLALDPLTRLNETLIRHALTRKMIFEIKTKTDLVRHLPGVPKRNIVISWSLNPAGIVRSEEHKSASLEARLNAAVHALKKGFRLGFHFDPLLMTPDWERQYDALIEKLTRRVPEREVLWVSMGSFRYPHALKSILDGRFPQSRIAAGEFIKGMDGKMRYPRPERTVLYQKVYTALRKRWREVWVYFCMENKAVWESVMGFAPEDNAHLDYLFHENIFRRFPDLKLPVPDLGAYRASKV